MQKSRKLITYLLIAAFTLQQPGLIHAWPNPFCKKEPETALIMVSRKIDLLEKQLNKDGTVVIKSPDIWGESRLTKHRQEFERILEQKVDDFELLLNASISRSDQAYLANSLAIQAALYDRNEDGSFRIPGERNKAVPSVVGDDSQTTNSMTFVQGTIPQTAAGPEVEDGDSVSTPIVRTNIRQLDNDGRYSFVGFGTNPGIGLEPTIELDQLKRYLDHLHEIRRVNEGDDTADSSGYSLNLVRVPVSIMPGEQTREGYGAEVSITAKPHISPELLPRVFRELVINDLIDLLALPVLKVAEEIERLHTHTPAGPCEGIRHYEHVYQAMPEDLRVQLFETSSIPKKDFFFKKDYYSNGRLDLEHHYDEVENIFTPKRTSILELFSSIESLIAGTFFDSQELTDGKGLTIESQSPIARTQIREFNDDFSQNIMNFDVNQKQSSTENSNQDNKPVDEKTDIEKFIYNNQILTREIRSFSQGVISSNLTRNSRQPLAPSQVVDVFGVDTLLRVGYEFWKTTQYQNVRHLMDAQGFLKEQLEASYDFLKTEEGIKYWQNVPQIHEFVRQDRLKYEEVRFNFDGQICLCCPKEPSRDKCKEDCDEVGSASVPELIRPISNFVFSNEMIEKCPELKKSEQQWSDTYVPEEDWKADNYAIGKLPRCGSGAENKLNDTPVTMGAWWILVEAALLNERLNLDLQRVSQDPECFCHCDEQYAFYYPHPCEEAKLAFIDYVNCRWPVHVFALDPVAQQQNIADTFSMRREMQLALSMAFASGNMSAQNMLKYARRLELDMETVALNHTVAGFGHGEDTFGWRFYPRVQTPPFEGNAKVIFRDMLWGGPDKDALRKTWEIEPGMRECVAIVLMPSFIEHLTFFSRGNYFKLSEQDRVKSTMVENARWSQNIREMEMMLEQLHCEADLYRYGEIERVDQRVGQIAKKLPLQTVHARVPNENTLGGFEMFSAGITDLGPELYGYYGTPGIDPNKETSVFLVGNHFSVHETKVLAGNRMCDFRLLSRQVMEVRVPIGVQVVTDKFSEYPACPERHVDVHVATPYGVSRHLEIPTVGNVDHQPTEYAWETNEVQIRYRYTVTHEKEGDKVINKYAITEQNVFVQHPLELSIGLPVLKPFVDKISLTPKVVYEPSTPISQASPQRFDEMRLSPPAEEGIVDSTALTTAFTDINYESSRNQYVLADKNYGEFHRALKTGVVTFYNKKYKNDGEKPPATIVFVLKNDGDAIKIPGSVRIVVTNEEL